MHICKLAIKNIGRSGEEIWEILHICKLAIKNICRSGEEIWEILQAASIEIADKNGIEVIIEKRKEFTPKVAVEMSKDQRPEKVQQSLKSILHRQGACVSIHS